MRYRILYQLENDTTGRYMDVEANHLADAVWAVAQETQYSTLIDTMVLPSKENSNNIPHHVNLYPVWSQE